MIDPIPRQDLKMPPPVGFVTTTAYFAMEQTLEARIAELQTALAEVTAQKDRVLANLKVIVDDGVPRNFNGAPFTGGVCAHGASLGVECKDCLCEFLSAVIKDAEQ